jgi:transposase
LLKTINLSADKARILELENEVSSLKALIQQLLQEIERLKHPKNSRNSSVPPSKDENRPLKTRSLRTPDGKKPGGQAGHEGKTLQMTDSPDMVIEHKPQYCNHCGDDISAIEPEFFMRHQVVDIPPIVPQYTEHRIYSTVCKCGHKTQTTFPTGVNAPISYGANIESIIAYMHTRQYIPFERLSEYFKDVCNLPISQSTIYDILERFARKATPAYQLIAKSVETSNVVGGDETGAKVNGKRGWFWTWQSKLATFIAFSFNRGTATTNANFVDGFSNAVFVHDCWKSHFETNAQTHQLCIAHLLRELKYFEERYLSTWATSFKKMLLDALELKKTLLPHDYFYPISQRTRIEETFNGLLQSSVPEEMKELCTFKNRMVRYKDYLFQFLYYHDVPPDNNASERAIRNIKVKLKVSGQFKTQRGAQVYAIIRSITDTCIKNNQNVLAAFYTIAKLHPE